LEKTRVARFGFGEAGSWIARPIGSESGMAFALLSASFSLRRLMLSGDSFRVTFPGNACPEIKGRGEMSNPCLARCSSCRLVEP
jgi:hypothetical protein